jgi:hypothetical protein
LDTNTAGVRGVSRRGQGRAVRGGSGEFDGLLLMWYSIPS